MDGIWAELSCARRYHEMAGRHRGQAESITIMKTAIIPAEKVRRDHVKQMLNSKLKSRVIACMQWYNFPNGK